jgi:aminomethyltransferase
MNFSPLDASHRALGAKMTEFGGWEMPLSYAQGTLAEHNACRQSAAMFDVSHLGTVRVEGSDAFDRLQMVLTNDLNKIRTGRAQYTHLLDEDDASVVDDIIVWWVDENRFDVMPNASNTDGVVAAIGGVDITRERAVIAVQGPEARERVSTFWPDAADVKRFDVRELNFGDTLCVVAGTGYTGEDGIEISVPREAASRLWDALLDAGVVPAGLGARDTLRLEAGLPLHGHELGKGITPLQAGLEWVVGWGKPTFIGRDALWAEKQNGLGRSLYGVTIEGRRPAREGSDVSTPNGEHIGYVTSGNFSPSLGHCIAFVLISGERTDGDVVSIDIRGTTVEGIICDVPFVAKK